MDRAEIIAVLKAREPDLRARGVARAALFGSAARGEARPDSDVDILVEIDPDALIDLYDYVGIVQLIESFFPVKVDVAERVRMFPEIKAAAERDAIYAF